MNLNPRVLVVGAGEAGKDTVAEMLANRMVVQYQEKYSNTSFVIAQMLYWINDHISLPKEEFDIVRSYPSDTVLWYHRREHREMFRKYGDQLLEVDPAFMSKQCALLWSQHVVVGVRTAKEILASKEIFDASIFVKRPGFEDQTLEDEVEVHCDYFLSNDGDLNDLNKKVQKLAFEILRNKLYQMIFR